MLRLFVLFIELCTNRSKSSLPQSYVECGYFPLKQSSNLHIPGIMSNPLCAILTNSFSRKWILHQLFIFLNHAMNISTGFYVILDSSLMQILGPTLKNWMWNYLSISCQLKMEFLGKVVYQVNAILVKKLGNKMSLKWWKFSLFANSPHCILNLAICSKVG